MADGWLMADGLANGAIDHSHQPSAISHVRYVPA
jgi:hypothetical protein